MKKKHMKFLAVAVALVMMLFTLAACGGGNAPAPAQTEAQTAAAAEVTTAAAAEAATEAAAVTEAATEAAAEAVTEAASEAATEAAAAPAGNAEYTFKVTHHQPEQSSTGKFVQAWCDAVTEASGGRIQFQVFSGGALAPAAEAYNVVKAGSADLAWGLPSFYQGTFPLTDVTGLPYTATDLYQGTYAMWDLYEKSEAVQAEWKDVHMILLHSNCDCPLLVKNPRPEKIEDLAGRQCRFVGGSSTDLANDLGIIAVNVQVQDIYESLEKGVIDSAANCGFEMIGSNKLYEPVDAIWNIKMNINPCFFVMNKEKYEALPDDLKAVIDEFSGKAAADMVLPFRAADQDKILAEHGDIIYNPDEETMEKFRELGKGVAERWCETNGETGKEVYDLWMQCLADHEGDIVYK